jgi:hypothetical protein
MKIVMLLGRSLSGALFLGAVLASSAGGCAGGGENREPDSCLDASCSAGMRCVQNECRPECATQSDCPVAQNCAGWGFDDGSQGQFCVVLDYAKGGRTGQFEACKADAECDALRGFTCVDGICRIRCDSHFECAGVGLCQSTASAAYCEPGTAAKQGQYYQHCPAGPSDCDRDAGFVCLSAGVADLDSYCTADCLGDAQCPQGFRCGTVTATPCMDACGVVGQQSSSCIGAAQIGPGKAYECVEPFGLVRHLCERRSFCSSCESNEDCLAVPGQICARDQSGQKICTQACDPSVDSCPWGNASECGVWDSALGIATCAHRFGSCQGEGRGCEPCVDGSDCAPTGFCSRSSFTGEQFCIDLSVECDCGADAENDTCTGHGCPDTPDGLPMICYAGSRFTGDPISNRCIGANSVSSVLSSPQSGCWSH